MPTSSSASPPPPPVAAPARRARPSRRRTGLRATRAIEPPPPTPARTPPARPAPPSRSRADRSQHRHRDAQRLTSTVELEPPTRPVLRGELDRRRVRAPGEAEGPLAHRLVDDGKPLAGHADQLVGLEAV